MTGRRVIQIRPEAQQVDGNININYPGQAGQMQAIDVHQQMQSAEGRVQDGERVQVRGHKGAGDGQVFIDIGRRCRHQHAV